MTTVAIMRALLLSMLLLTGAAACRDVGIVGEGSACPEACATNERCVNGTCVPRNDGVAGADEHEVEEREEEHEEESAEAEGE